MRYVYMLSPMDFWDGWIVYSTANARLYDEVVNAGLQTAQSAMSLGLKWEGDIRGDTVYVRRWAVAGKIVMLVAFKQENNGDTFIISPADLVNIQALCSNEGNEVYQSVAVRSNTPREIAKELNYPTELLAKYKGRVLEHVTKNPGCTLNAVRRVFHLDALDAETICELMKCEGVLRAESGNRVDSVLLFPVPKKPRIDDDMWGDNASA